MFHFISFFFISFCNVDPRKGNRRTSIGHCPHLWNPPLQPIHHSQQSYCMWHKYNELVFQHCGGFDDASSIASRASIFNFCSGGSSIAILAEIRIWVYNAIGHYSVLQGSLVLKLQYVSIKWWRNVLRFMTGISVKVKEAHFQGQI